MSTENQKNTGSNEKKSVKCGCGRSPTGQCVGWHSLSFELFEERKELYETGKTDIYGNELK